MIESSTYKPEKELEPKIIIEAGYNNFVPNEFKCDPFGYFERNGQNIKSGEVKLDEMGVIKEDPTAVKKIPAWMDEKGDKLEIIGKKVNTEKGKVGESGDPFYEYKIIKIVNNIGLPAPKPVAQIEQNDAYLFLMEKIEGIGWNESSMAELVEKGFSNEDIQILIQRGEEQMNELKKRFEEVGIIRSWKLKDMIFDIDFKNKKINKITPTDWERTKIDHERLEKYKNKRQ